MSNDLFLRFKILTAATSEHKRFWVWLLKIGALFVVFLMFFIPILRESWEAASKIQSFKEQILNVKKISLNLLTPEELKETEIRVNEFKSRLIDSSQVSALLDTISEEADKNHFNVIQIYSDSPSPVKDDAGNDLELDRKKLMILFVNFRAETDFKSLGNFLKSLKDNAKGNFVLEAMTLKKAEPQAETLQCDLTLSFVTV